MSRKPHFVGHLVLVLLTWSTAQAIAVDATRTARSPAQESVDVRIVVDVSGSMRAASALRTLALEHLIDNLPRGSRAGIWTFGQQVNMAMPHGLVDDAWRVSARAVARRLEVVGLRTNLRAALDTVMWDSDVGQVSRRDIVLVSDGRVDLSDEAIVNDTERRALIGEVLPRLAGSGFVLHGLALSTDADVAFLSQFAAATGGYVARPETEKELGEFVARAFARDVSLHGSFMVTAGQTEVTVAMVRRVGQPVALVSPAQQRIEADIVSSYVRWFDGDGDGDGDRTIVTLANPAPGRWQIEPPPQRMVVLDDLRAHIRPILEGDAVRAFEAYLTNGARLIEERMFDGLIIMKAERQSHNVLSTLRVHAPQPGSAVHPIELTADGFTGDDRLQVRALGPTFERAAEFSLRTHAPIRCEARPGVADDATLTLQLMLADVDMSSVRMIASLALPDGRTKLIGATAAGARHWSLTVPGFGNEVEVGFRISGNYLNKKEFIVNVDPFTMTLPLPASRHWDFDANGRALVDEAATETPLPALPAIEPVAEPVPSVEPAPAAASAVSDVQTQVVAEPRTDAPRSVTLWDAIGFGTLAGLNVLALLWFGFNVVTRRQVATANDSPGEASPMATALERYKDVLAKAETASVNTA